MPFTKKSLSRSCGSTAINLIPIQAELQRGYTAGFVLIGEDAARVDAGSRLIMRETRYRGYGARDETLNCADGYFRPWAANGYFNPRRAVVNTLNAAHTLCLDIPWGGQERNPSPYYPPNSPAMLMGLTRGDAPFGYADRQI